MENNGQQFIVLQDWMVKELKLKGLELIIYALIYGFSNIPEHDFHGSLAYLQEWTASSRPGVIKALQALLAKGLIKKIGCTDSGVNRYVAIRGEIKIKSQNKNTPKEADKVDVGSKQSIRGGVNKVYGGSKQSIRGGVNKVYPYNIIDNIEDNIEDNITRFFAQFWEKYPRKVDKKVALKAFKKIKKIDDAFMVKILEAIEKQKKTKQWQNKAYIPYPATWLNGERWNDEIEEIMPKTTSNVADIPIDLPDWLQDKKSA